VARGGAENATGHPRLARRIFFTPTVSVVQYDEHNTKFHVADERTGAAMFGFCAIVQQPISVPGRVWDILTLGEFYPAADLVFKDPQAF
jgi:hypothetical protein